MAVLPPVENQPRDQPVLPQRANNRHRHLPVRLLCAKLTERSWAQPYFWYYTVVDEDEKSRGKKLSTRIERKTKEKVAPNLLQDKFKGLDWAEEINQQKMSKVKQQEKLGDKNKVIACYMTSSVNPKDKREALYKK